MKTKPKKKQPCVWIIELLNPARLYYEIFYATCESKRFTEQYARAFIGPAGPLPGWRIVKYVRSTK